MTGPLSDGAVYILMPSRVAKTKYFWISRQSEHLIDMRESVHQDRRCTRWQDPAQQYPLQDNEHKIEFRDDSLPYHFQEEAQA